jgi:Rieske Fe-S protein
VATGFAGDGMIFGPLSAYINTDLILGIENPWADLYRLNRFKEKKEFLKRGYEFGKEMIKGRLGLRFSFDDIPIDSGKVVRCGGKKMAIYRDEKGEVTKLSPVCKHMGCIVDWNDEAKTWDCPCHGSRYDKKGGVLNGPTRKPLRVIDDEEDLDLDF